ncbi:hypothetical protein POM88_033269 [Heracleum sosnowskyi]|uniref:Uncharacterized protein n=1 Tax=Heracleum sosnowskyi TaxID=360622 RepID=A0AAD8I180_9APIA|nr:hypothetical protein POM88_033269 [Heracleum sosnowskyi]
MVRFICQEAQEKANEISVYAEEEFNIEKLQIVEAGKKKIMQEFERKHKQVEVHLPPPPSSHHAHGPSCRSGGIVMASRDGKRVIKNTVDAGLDLVMDTYEWLGEWLHSMDGLENGCTEDMMY